MRKFGVLGGTFDPPHVGHISVARSAIDALGLDEAIFLPAHRNPLKKGPETSAQDRMQMVKLAIKNEPKLSVSNIEIVRRGPSYAVDTMSQLTYAQPGLYWFILGSDAIKDIDKWKQPAKLVKMCRLGLVLRSGQDWEQLKGMLPGYTAEAIDLVPMPRVDISATELRQRIMSGRLVSQWMNPEVERYIAEHKLYR